MMGWTCCFHPSLVTAVQQENLNKSIALKLKESQNRSTFSPFYKHETYWQTPASKYDMMIFYALHAADIYSTYKGLKWDCINEANPLLPPDPHIDRLFIHKFVFLQPIDMLFGAGALIKEDVYLHSALIAGVVYSNLQLEKKASRRCNLR